MSLCEFNVMNFLLLNFRKEEKMKKCSGILLVCFVAAMTGSTFAASVYVLGSDNWTTAANWSTGAVPLASTADELKIFASASAGPEDFVITVNSNVGNYNGGSCKFDLARGTTLQVETGGYIGNNKEIHVGDAGASGNGTDIGYINQTGGTVDITGSGKLQIGYKAGGDGTYTISGGTLTGSAGRMYLGCSSADGSIGKLKVVGSTGTISLGGTMYIANDSETAENYTGTGTLEFVCDALGAVSKVQVAKSVIDSQNTGVAVANLVVGLTDAAPASTLVLVENTGTSAVVGLFDSLNGGSAAEGATVVLGGQTFTLTYQYAAGADNVANDIALVIPEPATIALLTLGLAALRRRK